VTTRAAFSDRSDELVASCPASGAMETDGQRESDAAFPMAESLVRTGLFSYAPRGREDQATGRLLRPRRRRKSRQSGIRPIHRPDGAEGTMTIEPFSLMARKHRSCAKMEARMVTIRIASRGHETRAISVSAVRG